MNKYHFFSMICFIGFIVSLILGFSSGDLKGGIFVVFPFITGTGLYGFFTMVFLFLAFLFFTLAFIKSFNFNKLDFPENNVDVEKSIKAGGIIFIGPIPIVFGSNWKIVVLLVLFAIVFLIISFFILQFY